MRVVNRPEPAGTGQPPSAFLVSIVCGPSLHPGTLTLQGEEALAGLDHGRLFLPLNGFLFRTAGEGLLGSRPVPPSEDNLIRHVGTRCEGAFWALSHTGTLSRASGRIWGALAVCCHQAASQQGPSPDIQPIGTDTLGPGNFVPLEAARHLARASPAQRPDRPFWQGGSPLLSPRGPRPALRPPAE